MKILALIFLLFSISYIIAQAQTIITNGGIAISTNTLNPQSPPGEINSVIGSSIGIGVEFHLHKKLMLYVEGGYVKKGFNFYSNSSLQNNPDILVIYDEDYKLNYLEFPVMVRKYFGKKPIQFYLNGGIYFDIGLGGTVQGEYGIYDRGFANSYHKVNGLIKYGDDPINNTNFDDRYFDNRIDYGFIVGTGIKLFDLIVLDACYSKGQVNLDEGYGTYKNNAFQISMGVCFKLKPRQ